MLTVSLNSFGLRERAFKLLGRLNVLYNSPHIVAVSFVVAAVLLV